MPSHWTKVKGQLAPSNLRLRKKNKHASSSTPGKSKGMRPSPEDKCMAKNARSYKTSGYERWATKYNGNKVRGSTS